MKLSMYWIFNQKKKQVEKNGQKYKKYRKKEDDENGQEKYKIS